MTCETLQYGSTGDPVKTLQTLLTQRGYVVVIDGDFRGQTLSAVKAFQTDQGIVVDGIVGPQTWAALVGLVDGTAGLTNAGGNTVTHTPQAGWATTAVNGVTLYWIRIRCTAANFTQQPIATQISVDASMDDYTAAVGLIHRYIKFTKQILPGYNELKFVVNGKNPASGGYGVSFGGLSIQ